MANASESKAALAADPLVVGDVVKWSQSFGPVGTTAYAAGQILLAPTEIAIAGRVDGGAGLVTSAGLALAVANTAAVDVLLFGAQPSGIYVVGTTLAAIAAADLGRISKVLHITDWTALGSACWGQAPAEPRFYRCDDAVKPRSLWVMAIARGAITLASPADATLSIRLARN